MPRPAELGARASRASREKGGPWDVRAMLLPYFEIVIALAENFPYMVALTVCAHASRARWRPFPFVCRGCAADMHTRRFVRKVLRSLRPAPSNGDGVLE